MKTSIQLIAPLALSFGANAVAQPAGFHDLVAIDAAVAAFTGAGIGVPGGANLPVDRRLRLAPCYAPLALSWHGTRQDNVLVQCPDPGGWRLFVAVSGNSRQDAAARNTLPPAVARGEAVTIAVEGDGFSVSQAGEAMEPGALGQWIRVRTSVKAVPIRARISRPGLVVVPVE
ncbi:flagella basal body P-ring formation protein FlgA [Novosphingobium sp. SL115]|uniref:flagella basal body P-ring formation protein FlgA n=1 Tax=Novosphingobium sp. SL115 TaxID=2995150 RepID=UPI0022737B84|nr:flagella basal body P-ring formation protein FlgA [Novosphingobium sp. SL115]MCY1669999.1 flagella basal body P-ring formation protein FlgA [Novosphingobium sp. SL115]